MLTPEQFKLLGILPGLYAARDQIQNQIDQIENQFAPKRGRKPKALKEIMGEKPKSKARSERMKQYWASLTPEQAEARKKKMVNGIKKTWREKKAARAQAA